MFYRQLFILFFFKLYLYTNIETLFKITNCQYTKLSKLQINEIANHTTHNNITFLLNNLIGYTPISIFNIFQTFIYYVNVLFTIILILYGQHHTLQHHSSSASEPIDNHKSQFQFSFKYLIEIEEE